MIKTVIASLVTLIMSAMTLKAEPVVIIDCGELGEHALHYKREWLLFNNPSVGGYETYNMHKWSDNEIIGSSFDWDWKGSNSAVFTTKHLNRDTGELVVHQQVFKLDVSIPAASSVQSATCTLKKEGKF